MLTELGASHAVLITPELARYIEQQEADETHMRLHLQQFGTLLVATLPSFKVRSLPLVDIQQLAEHCSGISHLILDLRLNDGWSGSVVSEVASLFLPPDTPLFRVKDRAGFRLAHPWIVSTFPETENLDHEREVAAILEHHYVEYRTKANPLTHYSGPIIILLDQSCYSCGELFVQAMKEHSNALIVGQPSRGFVLAANDYDVGEGYRLMLPFAEMRSGKGVLLEGTGVEPHLSLEMAGLDTLAALKVLEEKALIPSSFHPEASS